MNALVIYYSRTGNTQVIAKAIATQLNATIEQITEYKKYSGITGYIRAAYQAIRGEETSIRANEINHANYDIVIIGAPVWASNIPPPMLSYIQHHKHQLKSIAFFCTEGGSGGARMFDKMKTIIGKPAVDTLEITEKELKNKSFNSKLVAFSKKLNSVVETEPKADFSTVRKLPKSLGA